MKGVEEEGGEGGEQRRSGRREGEKVKRGLKGKNMREGERNKEIKER